jgi:hypothetical protein
MQNLSTVCVQADCLAIVFVSKSHKLYCLSQIVCCEYSVIRISAGCKSNGKFCVLKSGEGMCELPLQFIIEYDPEALQSSLNPHSPFFKKIRFNIILQYFHPSQRQLLYVHSVRRFFAFTFYCNYS